MRAFRELSARHRAILLVVAPFAALTLMGMSCAVNQPFPAPGDVSTDAVTRTIQFEGDSITVRGKSEINATFAPPDWSTAIHATEGIDAATSGARIAKDAALAPDVAVINLGTNDVQELAEGEGTGLKGTPFTEADLEASLQQFYDEFTAAGTSCVVFVTIDDQLPSWGPSYAADVDDFLLSTFPNVADWNSAIAPGDYSDADDPHPSDAGEAHLTQVIDQAVEGCFPDDSTTTTTTATDDTTTTSVDDTTTTTATDDTTTTSVDDTTTTTAIDDTTTTSVDDTTTSTDDTSTTVPDDTTTTTDGS